MPINAEDITTRLTQFFGDVPCKLVDTVGDQNHYHLTITSVKFSGLPRVQRHQLVYQALSDVIGGALHALSISAHAPDD